jgi:ankyrin repeat protein
LNGDLPIHLAMQFEQYVYVKNNIAMQNENMIIVEHLLRIYPESVSRSNLDGEFPLHFAAKHQSLALIKRLLIAYPTAASMITARGLNILHCAMSRNDEDAEIVTYISTQYPNLIHGVSDKGYTPLHLALDKQNFNGITSICKVDAQVIMDVVRFHLSNPLHMFLEFFFSWSTRIHGTSIRES